MVRDTPLYELIDRKHAKQLDAWKKAICNLVEELQTKNKKLQADLETATKNNERLQNKTEQLRSQLVVASTMTSNRRQKIQELSEKLYGAEQENGFLRKLIDQMMTAPFGECPFSHLYNDGHCGECEACEYTEEVMKSARGALEG